MNIDKLLLITDMLPSPQKEIVLLYYKEGLSQKQIATNMGITLYRVRIYLTKALYLLKKESGDEMYENARKILYDKI